MIGPMVFKIRNVHPVYIPFSVVFEYVLGGPSKIEVCTPVHMFEWLYYLILANETTVTKTSVTKRFNDLLKMPES
jgi:hypothetical protein